MSCEGLQTVGELSFKNPASLIKKLTLALLGAGRSPSIDVKQSLARGPLRTHEMVPRADASRFYGGGRGMPCWRTPLRQSTSSGQGMMVDFTVRIAIASSTARLTPSSVNG